MNSIELTVLTNTAGSELVADALYEFGSAGVAIYDTSDVEALIKSEVIWDYIDEELLKKNETVSVKGYYPENEYESVKHKILDKLEELKQNSDYNLGSLETSCRVVDDEDWVNVWKTHYQPIVIGKIAIVPKWLKYDPKDGVKPVYIDPGMAFGTGEHETTKICIAMLEECDVKGKRVLDIGTGSGILGICAYVLGAKSVFMSDIDEIAIKSAKINATYNNIDYDSVSIERCDLMTDESITGDIVIANITADILIRLSKDLTKHVVGGGKIIISGIIKSRYNEVLEHFLKAGFSLDKTVTDGEWCGIRFSYNARLSGDLWR